MILEGEKTHGKCVTLERTLLDPVFYIKVEGILLDTIIQAHRWRDQRNQDHMVGSGV